MATNTSHRDPRSLRPGELCQLLNSTPRGEVINERQLRRQRTRAGLRVASGQDPNRVDLLRYTAWLMEQRHASAPTPTVQDEGLTGYDAQRARAVVRKYQFRFDYYVSEIPKSASYHKQAAKQPIRCFLHCSFSGTFGLKTYE